MRVNALGYVCGPTSDYEAHIGNYRTLVSSINHHRELKKKKYRFVRSLRISHKGGLYMNITDLAESTITASKKKQITLKKHNNLRIREYIDVLKRMEMKPWTLKIIRCTSKLKLMQRIIRKISESKDNKTGELVYSVDSGIMFQPIGRKKSQQFHLWRIGFHLENEYIRGIPGWHNECAAIVQNFCNKKLIYHYGGKDLRDLHHKGEKEILEVTSPNLKIIWKHTNAITNEGIKMSKSKGNVLCPANQINLRPLKEFFLKTDMDNTIAIPDHLDKEKKESVLVKYEKLSKGNKNVLRWHLQREKQKSNKNFLQADLLRKMIRKKGYDCEDLKNKSKLIFVRSIKSCVKKPTEINRIG